jgi:hypothetical protein
VRRLPPTPLAPLAAAAALVVAAALVTLALAAGDGVGRPGSPPASSSAASPTLAVPPTSVPAQTPPAGKPAIGGRLFVVVGAPSRPRARLCDPAAPEAAGFPLDLPGPVARDRLAALVAAPDGRLAAVTPGGAVWIGPPPRTAADERQWVALPLVLARPLPGPVLGAAWSSDATRLILLAGAPGSGARRSALVSVPLDGGPASTVEIPLEADGPGIAALPEGRVAFVGRDMRDRGALAQVAAGGSFVTRPVAARSVAAGGDVVALVDDLAVWVGSLADLDRGLLPAQPLPLIGTSGIGAVAIAPDGSAVAVVRLDEGGAATRIDLLWRRGGSWLAAGSVLLDPADGTAIPGWLP